MDSLFIPAGRLTQAHVGAHWWHFFPQGEYVDPTGTDVKTGGAKS
jgi:hypothetical protein